jgi:hypothetical protein
VQQQWTSDSVKDAVRNSSSLKKVPDFTCSIGKACRDEGHGSNLLELLDEL